MKLETVPPLMLSSLKASETFSFIGEDDIYIMTNNVGTYVCLTTGHKFKDALDFDKAVRLRHGTFMEDGWLRSSVQEGDIIEIDGVLLGVTT